MEQITPNFSSVSEFDKYFEDTFDTEETPFVRLPARSTRANRRVDVDRVSGSVGQQLDFAKPPPLSEPMEPEGPVVLETWEQVDEDVGGLAAAYQRLGIIPTKAPTEDQKKLEKLDKALGKPEVQRKAPTQTVEALIDIKTPSAPKLSQKAQDIQAKNAAKMAAKVEKKKAEVAAYKKKLDEEAKQRAEWDDSEATKRAQAREARKQFSKTFVPMPPALDDQELEVMRLNLPLPVVEPSYKLKDQDAPAKPGKQEVKEKEDLPPPVVLPSPELVMPEEEDQFPLPKPRDTDDWRFIHIDPTSPEQESLTKGYIDMHIHTITEDLTQASTYFAESSKTRRSIGEIMLMRKQLGGTVPDVGRVRPRSAVPEAFSHPPKVGTPTIIDQALKEMHGTVKTSARGSYILVPPLVAMDKGAPSLEQYVGVELLPGIPIVDKYPNFLAPYELPVFTPSYYTVNYNRGFYVGLEARAYDGRVPLPLKKVFEASLHRVHEVVENNYFGNGTPHGQLERFAKVKAVSDRVTQGWAKYGVSKLWTDDKEYARVMKEWYPLATPDYELVGAPLKIDEEYVQAHPNEGGLLSLEPKADAGPMWPHIKKGQVFIQDATLAAQCLLDLKVLSISDWWSKWAFLRLGNLKPKAEVYLRSDFKKKTRNIVVLNAAGQIPIQTVLKGTYKSAPTFIDHPTSRSMVGWSPFHGGIDALVTHFYKRPKVPLVFADNFYAIVQLGGKKYFASFDGEKFEGVSRSFKVKKMYERALALFPKVDPEWRTFMTEVAPTLVSDVVAVFGARQIPMPWLSSGAQGTGYVNTENTIGFVYEWEKLTGGDFVLEGTPEAPIWPEDAKVCMAKAGAYMTIESLVPFDELYNVTSGKVLRTDLLGYSCASMANFGVKSYIPVLDRIRLEKALSFDKTNEKVQAKMTSSLKKALKLIKLRALYLIGGWHYPGLAEEIKIQANAIVADKTIDFAKLDAETIANAADEATAEVLLDNLEMAKQFAAVVSRASVPSLYEVVELGVSEGKADSLLRFAAKDPILRTDIYNLAPIEHVKRVLGEMGLEVPIPKTAVVASIEGESLLYAIRPVTEAMAQVFLPETEDWAEGGENPMQLVNLAYERVPNEKPRGGEVPAVKEAPDLSTITKVNGGDFVNPIDIDGRKIGYVCTVLAELAKRTGHSKILVDARRSPGAAPFTAWLAELANLTRLRVNFWFPYRSAFNGLTFAASVKGQPVPQGSILSTDLIDKAITEIPRFADALEALADASEYSRNKTKEGVSVAEPSFSVLGVTLPKPVAPPTAAVVQANPNKNRVGNPLLSRSSIMRKKLG